MKWKTTSKPDESLFDIRWSQSGERIAYISGTDKETSVFLMDHEGRNKKLLCRLPGALALSWGVAPAN